MRKLFCQHPLIRGLQSVTVPNYRRPDACLLCEPTLFAHRLNVVQTGIICLLPNEYTKPSTGKNKNFNVNFCQQFQNENPHIVPRSRKSPRRSGKANTRFSALQSQSKLFGWYSDAAWENKFRFL
jgi:hypothetical protein